MRWFCKGGRNDDVLAFGTNSCSTVSIIQYGQLAQAELVFSGFPEASIYSRAGWVPEWLPAA